jgi:hypothetical protein
VFRKEFAHLVRMKEELPGGEREAHGPAPGEIGSHYLEVDLAVVRVLFRISVIPPEIAEGKRYSCQAPPRGLLQGTINVFTVLLEAIFQPAP